MKILNKTIIFSVLLLLTLNFSASENAFAQQEIRWLRVGMLHSWYSDVGSEIEIGRTGQASEQQDGLRWPAQFRFQDCEAAKSMWIGTTNYFDRKLNTTVPYKVVSVGTRNFDRNGEIMPVEFKMIGRFPAPSVIVDGETATDNRLNDVVDEIDENLIPDRMIVNTTNSYIGITTTRKIMAFSQQNHDNYFIYDYVFKNTGIVDLNGTVETKTLTGVVFHFQYRYAIGHEAFKKGWTAADNINWGRNIVNQTVGTDPTDPNFEYRAQYSWYGPHSQSPVSDWGAPRWQLDGLLGAVQYVGVVTMHADKSVHDKNDDPYEPKTTQYIGSDTGPQAFDQFNPALMAKKYEVMTAGHPEKTHAEEVGNSFADLWGNDGGGYSQGQGFGPYTLEPGDSIHIVLAEGVSGISREQNVEVGKNWFNDNSPFILPDGSTSTNRDTYKKLWVQTGEDSLMKTFRHALSNYNSQFNIPQPPPPPNYFEVISGGDRIKLKWGDNADSWPNFDGYQIYRAVGKPDTFYVKIFSCDVNNTVHEFNDTTARRGFDYYYYIQTKDDGSTNDFNPGVPLVSSMFYTVTNKPAFLRRPAAESLDEIRVVPNPFHIKARSIQFGLDAPDRLAFFGLPPECTIKIYTERGDLVDTIEHTDGSGDELWNSLTSSGQLVVSGLYIAVFETPDNKTIVRKFIVIR